jgi:hypothetical protein
VVRGVVAFVDSLSVGMKMTTRSAELYGRASKKSRAGSKNGWLQRPASPHGYCNCRCGGSCGCARGRPLRILAFADNAADLLEGSDPAHLEDQTEGLWLIIFLAYITVIALMKVIRRVYMYTVRSTRPSPATNMKWN